MEELVNLVESLRFNEKKMELEAIDEVAWRRIIQFLDPKSRLQCRLLSNTIESYVNYMGLQLRVPDMQRQTKHEKKVWRTFVTTEEIIFGKVHTTADGTDMLTLGLQVRHNVHELEISGSFRLKSLLDAKWTQNLATLVLHREALECPPLFSRVDDQQTLIILPCLTKFYLDMTGCFVSNERMDDTLQNICELLSRTKSKCMEVLAVTIGDDDEGLKIPHYQIQLDLVAFLQSNAKLLQTVSFKFFGLTSYNYDSEEDSPASPLHPEFTSILLLPNLKHVNIHLIKFHLPHSRWLNMLMQLTHLEELVDNWTADCFRRLELPMESYMGIMGQLCRQHFRSLKYIRLHVQISAMDLGIFGCCSNLEHLHLYCKTGNGRAEYSSLSMLPTSLKVLEFSDNYAFWSDHTCSEISPTYEDILHVSKMKNLVELEFRNFVHLSANGFVQLVKAAMGLPKLNFLNIHYVSIQAEGFPDACHEFFPNLCEKGECKEVFEKPCTPLTLSFVGKVVEIEPETNSKGTDGAGFRDLYYRRFFESASHCQKAQVFMDKHDRPPMCHTLPEISETKFQLSLVKYAE